MLHSILTVSGSLIAFGLGSTFTMILSFGLYFLQSQTFFHRHRSIFTFGTKAIFFLLFVMSCVISFFIPLIFIRILFLGCVIAIPIFSMFLLSEDIYTKQQ